MSVIVTHSRPVPIMLADLVVPDGGADDHLAAIALLAPALHGVEEQPGEACLDATEQQRLEAVLERARALHHRRAQRQVETVLAGRELAQVLDAGAEAAHLLDHHGALARRRRTG